MRHVRSTVVLAAALVLGACTVTGGQQVAPVTAEGSPPASEASTGPSTEDEEEQARGPAPEELSAQVLDAASAPRDEPVASQTVTVDTSSGAVEAAEVTFDVLSVERTRDATLLTFQMSSPQAGVRPGGDAFSDTGGTNREFFDRFALEDPVGGLRYLPLSWRRADTDELQPPDGPPNSCVCAYRGNDLTLSPEPIVFESLYGPLPDDVTTVTFAVPSGVSIPDIPVR